MTDRFGNEDDYARRRRRQELDAARSATTARAREAHQELARISTLARSA